MYAQVNVYEYQGLHIPHILYFDRFLLTALVRARWYSLWVWRGISVPSWRPLQIFLLRVRDVLKIESILMAIVELFFAWQNLVRRFSKYWLVCSGLEEFICGAYHFSFLFKFYLFLFNFSSVILISAPKRDEESEESGNLMRYM